MNSKLSIIFAFSLGAAVGSAVSWGILKRRYEQITREEIADVKAHYSSKKIKSEEETSPESDVKEEPSMREYAAKLSEQGYTNYSDIKEEKKVDEPMKKDGPYVISPDEFDEIEEYDKKTLIYYADGVLTNEEDEIMEDDDVEDIIGSNALNTFGEYEDDSVHVRNDQLECDYEILKDQRRYSDVKKPARPSEVED